MRKQYVCIKTQKVIGRRAGRDISISGIEAVLVDRRLAECARRTNILAELCEVGTDEAVRDMAGEYGLPPAVVKAATRLLPVEAWRENCYRREVEFQRMMLDLPNG